jgi:preprotein translocase subunit SecA
MGNSDQAVIAVEIRSREQNEEAAHREPQVKNVQYRHGDYREALVAPEVLATLQPVQRAAPKVGRNIPSPCGRGKKYKRYHGKLNWWSKPCAKCGRWARP